MHLLGTHPCMSLVTALSSCAGVLAHYTVGTVQWATA